MQLLALARTPYTFVFNVNVCVVYAAKYKIMQHIMQHIKNTFITHGRVY